MDQQDKRQTTNHQVLDTYKKWSPIRWLYIILGVICVILAIFGVVLPLLPTVPFLILAAFCFKRSSLWFYNLLVSIPAFGKAIQEWEDHKIIRKKYKILSISILSLSMGWVLFTRVIPLIAQIGIVLCWLTLTYYISSRNGVSKKSKDH